MIFASDLDRTLIYSAAAIREHHPDGMDAAMLIPVERHKDAVISYMSVKANEWLRDLSQLATFVPVTTRTVEQYQRIFYLSDEWQPEYAITSNGGTVLYQGQPDGEWAAQVTAAMQHVAAPEEVMSLFQGEFAASDWIVKQSFADQLFYAMRIERDRLPAARVEQFRNQMDSLGWEISIQGRKLYLVPKPVNKGAALLYVKQRLAADYVAASGDSLLDWSLLQAADYAIAPRHGELFSTYGHTDKVAFTAQAGLYASEQLLQDIYKYAVKVSTRNPVMTNPDERRSQHAQAHMV